MESAVKELPDGVEFNLKHPSFQKLIKMVKEHDAKLKGKNKDNSNGKKKSKKLKKKASMP